MRAHEHVSFMFKCPTYGLEGTEKPFTYSLIRTHE